MSGEMSGEIWGAAATIIVFIIGSVAAIMRSQSTALATHEKLDQTRHEENLERFGDLKVALERLKTILENGLHR
jgi:hypothetical protein